jgi:mono/diheme cytochrome c family protein
VKNRAKESPGVSPCTELETRGGIWRYDASRTGQHFSKNERYATGIRNAVGIAIDPSGQVYSTQHGRDQLAENWPKLYTPVQGQNFPSEELLRITQGADFGWPVCYFDSTQVKLVLAPEYGGDGGSAIGECGSKQAPAAYFPAHWGPNALVFYNAGNFPAAYKGGAFIAFHGSWNRAPAPQGGYNVVFVPFAGGQASEPSQVFADGFAGGMKEPGKAAFRPSGLAVGPDGTLYIGDDVHGRIWRVMYGGKAVPAPTVAAAPTPAPAAPSAGPSVGAAARAAGITPAMVALGDSIFHGQVANGTCSACHGSDAKGTPLAPDLTDSKWLWSDGSYKAIVRTVTEGVPAPREHRGVMPPMGGAQLTPAQVGAVGAYVFALSHPG